MTLDEAIKHAEDVAFNRENGLYDAIALGGQNPSQEEIDECMKCAEEHRQIAEWLKELKMYKFADEQDNNRLYIRIYANDEPSRKVEKLYQICGKTESHEVAQWLKEYFPSADRSTGKWVVKEKNDADGYYWWRECSECGRKPLLDRWNHCEKLSDFCPCCGARMLDMDYQRATEQVEHDMTYEPTYNSEDGSL